MDPWYTSQHVAPSRRRKKGRPKRPPPPRRERRRGARPRPRPYGRAPASNPRRGAIGRSYLEDPPRQPARSNSFQRTRSFSPSQAPGLRAAPATPAPEAPARQRRPPPRPRQRGDQDSNAPLAVGRARLGRAFRARAAFTWAGGRRVPLCLPACRAPGKAARPRAGVVGPAARRRGRAAARARRSGAPGGRAPGACPMQLLGREGRGKGTHGAAQDQIPQQQDQEQQASMDELIRMAGLGSTVRSHDQSGCLAVVSSGAAGGGVVRGAPPPWGCASSSEGVRGAKGMGRAGAGRAPA
jgi:hypothetical protein